MWNWSGENGTDAGYEGEKPLQRYGGEAKLAATLARQAELYLLDEPLNGIDYKAREEIINLILEEADGRTHL